jgi:hypothetical protein
MAEAWVQGVIDEAKALDLKIQALTTYIAGTSNTTPAFSTLAKPLQLLLEAQLTTMSTYVLLLNCRLVAAGQSPVYPVG